MTIVNAAYRPVEPSPANDCRPVEDAAAEAIFMALSAAAEARWAFEETAAKFAALRRASRAGA